MHTFYSLSLIIFQIHISRFSNEPQMLQIEAYTGTIHVFGQTLKNLPQMRFERERETEKTQILALRKPKQLLFCTLTQSKEKQQNSC